jgi:hypothetical protein
VSPSLAAGLAAGLGSVAISEALLAWWSRRPQTPAMQVALAGLGLRTVWMGAALGIGLGAELWEPEPYLAALLGTYLIAQIVEGIRYRRFVDNR